MPFTIGGEWTSSEEKKPKPPMKIIKEKRKNSLVTRIINPPGSKEEIKELSSSLKKQLGCGGTVQNEEIILQGDRVQEVKEILKKNSK